MTHYSRAAARLSLKLLLAVTLVAVWHVLPARAAAGQVEALSRALRLEEMIEVISAEARDLGDQDVEADYGVPRARVQAMMDRLYAPDPMTAAFERALAQAFGEADLSEMIAFYTSDLGAQIAELELATRRLFSDEAAQDAAGQAWAALRAGDPRTELIEAYVAAGDLVEMNVVGTLNSDVAFYRGMGRVAADPDMLMSEEEIMAAIWSTEPEVRADVAEWVYGFSTMAYAPLSDGDLATYVAFLESPAGQKLNYALFAAFDSVFEEISLGMGLSLGMLMAESAGEEL